MKTEKLVQILAIIASMIVIYEFLKRERIIKR